MKGVYKLGYMIRGIDGQHERDRHIPISRTVIPNAAIMDTQINDRHLYDTVTHLAIVHSLIADNYDLCFRLINLFDFKSSMFEAMCCVSTQLITKSNFTPSKELVIYSV